MKNDVGPDASRSRRNDSLIPRTTDDIATTTNTPSATPMMVRPARTLLDRRASSAMPTPSNAIANGVKRRIGLLLAQRVDGIQPRRLPGRIHAGGHADPQPEQR